MGNYHIENFELLSDSELKKIADNFKDLTTALLVYIRQSILDSEIVEIGYYDGKNECAKVSLDWRNSDRSLSILLYRFNIIELELRFYSDEEDDEIVKKIKLDEFHQNLIPSGLILIMKDVFSKKEGMDVSMKHFNKR